MAVTYTTAAKVKSRFEDFDTDLDDTEINEFILTAESLVDCAMMQTARGTKKDFIFATAKHGIIEESTSCLAAFACLTAQPTGQSGNISSARAGLMASLLWATFRRNLRILGDSRIQKFLKGL